MRNFSDLTEREILALAIASEEEDGRVYADLVEQLRRPEALPAAVAKVAFLERSLSLLLAPGCRVWVLAPLVSGAHAIRRRVRSTAARRATPAFNDT